MTPLITTQEHGPIVHLTLNAPDRRNALSEGMFEGMKAAVEQVRHRDDLALMILRGAGPAFCAGFDLAAAVESPQLMGRYIILLSELLRAIRQLPQVVIASVHGAAIAGGCALVSACDFVVTSRKTKFGYPVHRIGISPAVTLPTLTKAIGEGPARSLVMDGELIDGTEAHRIGLATHLVDDHDAVLPAAEDLAQRISAHGRFALRVTKRWLNELEGAYDHERFTAPAEHSAAAAGGREAQELLASFWQSRAARNRT